MSNSEEKKKKKKKIQQKFQSLMAIHGTIILIPTYTYSQARAQGHELTIARIPPAIDDSKGVGTKHAPPHHCGPTAKRTITSKSLFLCKRAPQRI